VAQVAVEFADDVVALLLFLLVLTADFGESFRKPACVSWLSLGHFQETCTLPKCLILLARPKRFELLTPRFVVWCPHLRNRWSFCRLADGSRERPPRKARLRHDVILLRRSK
jgi:hypothetical protein